MAVLIQIDAYDPVAAAPLVVRVASADDDRLCMLPGAPWWPVAGQLPKLAYDLFSGLFDGRIETPAASMTLSIEPWPTFARCAFADARVQIWTGTAGAAFGEYIRRFDGRVTAQPTIEGGQASLAIAVDDRWLDAPLLDLYAGTGGIEGAAGVAQQPRPLALGAPRYAAGTLIDPIHSVVQLSGYGPIEAVDVALDRLARFGPSVGDHPSLAALVAATVPAGSWATALAIGAVRHGAPPAGKLSYLLRGDRTGAGGWVRRPGALIRRITEIAGQAARIDAASLAHLDIVRPYDLSVMVTEQVTVRELVQRIAASVNAVAGVTWLGQLFVAPVGIAAAAVLDLFADGSALPPVAQVAQVEVGAPVWRSAIEAERAWSVHAPEDIAFTATLVEIGAWSVETLYREGNIVSKPDGSRWLYTAIAPSAGNPLPAPPAEVNEWWRQLTGPVAAEWDRVTGPARPEDHATDGAYVDPTREHGGLRGPDGALLSVVQIVNTPYTLTPDGELLAALYGGGTESAGRIDLLDANAAAGRAIERVRVLVDGVQDDVLAAILAADLVRREQVATEASVRRDVSERIIEGERATAAERTTITARIAGAEARVSDLRITTATALAATAAQILTVSASLAGATAQIEIQRAASVTRDDAIASSVASVNAELGTARARIESVATASASADRALAGSITTLDAELGTARGRIEQVSIASADRDAALASRIDSIDATYGGNSAAIEDRLTALADADGALAGRASSLEAATGDTNARIGREEVARAEADRAVAGSIETITTRVGASEATILDFAESIDGLRARRGVVLDVNGYATGWTLDNDGQTGGFDLVADRVRVAKPPPAIGPPEPPKPMFVIEDETAKFAIPLVARSIDTDVLKVRGVLAENLDFGAVGDVSIYYHAVDFDVDNGGGWTALSGLDMISEEGSPIQGEFAFAAKHVAAMADVRLRVVRVGDGTVVWGTAAGTLIRPTSGGLTVSGKFFDSVDAGTQVQYDVQMSTPAGSIVRCSMRTMTVEELLKRRFQSIQIYTAPGEGPGSGAGGGGQINGDAVGTGGATGTGGGGAGSGTGGGLRNAQQLV